SSLPERARQRGEEHPRVPHPVSHEGLMPPAGLSLRHRCPSNVRRDSQPPEPLPPARPSALYRATLARHRPPCTWFRRRPPVSRPKRHRMSEKTHAGPSEAELDGYLRLTQEDVARLVLCLLIQEALQSKLADLPEAVQAHVRHQHQDGQA